LSFFLLALALKFAPVWEAGSSRAVPVSLRGSSMEQMLPKHRATTKGDVTFYTWLSARNARTLVTHPLRLFDAEHCAPTEKALALSAPGITLGLYGIPAVIATGDPIFTYNTVVAAMILIAAFAMYLLVAEWTGSAAAGVIGGLLYAFHSVRLDRITWVAEMDTTWVVFALLVSRRLFETWRWSDALLLAIVCCLQMATSFYSLLSSALLGVCFLVWLVASHGVRPVKPSRLVLVLVTLSAVAALLFGPYLDLRSGDVLFDRRYRTPMPLSAYLPGKPFFLGYTLLALALSAFVGGRRGLDVRRRGDPRWAMLAALVVIALVAADWSLALQARALWPDLPLSPPNFYALLAHVLPGLRNIRVVHLIASGVHLAACVLAGIGAAALIRRCGRWQAAAATALIAVSFLDVMGPRLPGINVSSQLEGIDVQPDPERIAFSERLGRLEEKGAMIELPIRGAFEPERVLLSFYHRRRTSGCYSSYPTEAREALTELVRLPLGSEAIRGVRRHGFTTIVVRTVSPLGAAYDRALTRLASAPRPIVERVLHASGLSAYEILLPANGNGRDEPRSGDVP